MPDPLTSTAINALLRTLDRLLVAIDDKKKREALLDDTWESYFELLDFLVDEWVNIRIEKEREGGYDSEVDEIEDLIAEIRDNLRALHRLIRAGELDEARTHAEAVREDVKKLKRLLRSLRRRQARARRRARQAKRRARQARRENQTEEKSR